MDTLLKGMPTLPNYTNYNAPIVEPTYNTVPSKIPPSITTTGTGQQLFTPYTAGSQVSSFQTFFVSSLTGDVAQFSSITAQYANLSTISTNAINLNGNVLTTNDVGGGQILVNGVPVGGGGGSPTTWANFPAISSINASGNDLLNVSSIIGETGRDLLIRPSPGNALVLQGEIAFDKLGGGLPSEIKLANDGTIAFGATLVGQLTNVSTINGQSVDARVASLNGIDGAVSLTAGTNISLSSDVGAKTITINATAPGVSNTITGQNTFMTATGATLATANANITAGGGIGGNITAIANAGDLGVSGGNISMTANGGTGLGGLYGVINMTANPGTDLVSGLATGGSINILANSPTLGATSKVAITGGGVNIYSGIFTPLASVFGYTFINASLGTSIVSGGFSPFPQSPGTTYIYGAQGTIIDNGLYTTDIQPIWDGNPLVPPAPLTIHGRTAGGSNVPVILNNVNNVSMQGSGAITGLNTINGSPYVPGGSVPPDLQVSTLTFNPLNGNISSLNAINNGLFFTETGDKMSFIPVLGNFVGEIEGLKSLNIGLGISPVGDKITFPPTVDAGLQGQIEGLSTINGMPYPMAGTSITNAGATVECDTGGNISILTATTATESITMNSQGNTVIGTTSGANSITLNDAGVVDIISGSGKSSYIAFNGTTINETGDTLTFAQVGGADVGKLVGIVEINGSAYPPSGSAGVSELNGCSGVVEIVGGTNITITPDTVAGTITVDALPVLAGVETLNGQSGAVDLSSPDGSISIIPSSTNIVELTVVKDVSVSVVSPMSSPEVVAPVSGTFYAIDANSTSATVSFDMSGLLPGTTFTVKNVSSTNEDLIIEFDDGTGSIPANGVNLPLLHANNTRNSVLCVCSWDGTMLTVY